MNVHDSERMAGLLEAAGYDPLGHRRRRRRRRVQHLRGARERRQPLYGNLSHLRAGQARPPGHADRRRRLPRPEGPRRRSCAARRGSTSCSARTTCTRCRSCWSAPGTTPRRRSRSPSRWRCSPRRCRRAASPPTRAGSRSRSGCNNTCTFCIVPALRGTEKRPPSRRRARRGAGAGRRRRARGDAARARTSTPTASSSATAVPSRSCCGPAASIDGLERVRFTSPHPRDFTSDVIAAMAETPERLPAAAHAAAVRLRPGARGGCAARTGRRGTSRSSTRCAHRDARRRDHHRHHRRASPARPRRTSRPRSTSSRRRGSPSAFTFQYSKRPGTPAADLPDQLPKAVVQERYMRLVALQEEISWAANRALEGRVVEVLVAAGEGTKDSATQRLSRSRARRASGALHPGGGPRPPRRRRRGRGDLRRTAPPRRRLAGALAPRTRAGDAPRRASGAARDSGLPGFGAPAPVTGGLWRHVMTDHLVGPRRGGRLDAELRIARKRSSGAPTRAPPRSRRRRGACRARLAGPAVDRCGAAAGRSLAGLASPTSACCRGCSPSPRVGFGVLPARPGPVDALVGAGLGVRGRQRHLVVTGVWAVWSRQTVVPDGGTGPHVGHGAGGPRDGGPGRLWSRIALRR